MWAGGCKGAQEGGREFAIPKQTAGEHGDDSGAQMRKGQGKRRKGNMELRRALGELE